MNNTGYSLVGATSHKLANSAGLKNLMPLFQLFLILFNGITRIINAKYLIRVRHTRRIYANTIIMVTAYVLVVIAELIGRKFGLVLSLFASVLHGITLAFGEAVILGYLKGFPTYLVGAWSSGTGFAGVSVFLLLQALHFPMYAVSIIYKYIYIYIDILSYSSHIHSVHFMLSICESEEEYI